MCDVCKNTTVQDCMIPHVDLHSLTSASTHTRESVHFCVCMHVLAHYCVCVHACVWGGHARAWCKSIYWNMSVHCLVVLLPTSIFVQRCALLLLFECNTVSLYICCWIFTLHAFAFIWFCTCCLFTCSFVPISYVSLCACVYLRECKHAPVHLNVCFFSVWHVCLWVLAQICMLCACSCVYAVHTVLI